MVFFRGKCLVIGDSTAGKTAVCQMLHSDGAQYPKNYQMTLGVELLVKAISIPETSDTVELFLYDCSGKDMYTDLIEPHLENSSITLAVYDVTSESSFGACAQWIKKTKTLNGSAPLLGAVFANRTDLTNRRVISPEEGQNLAEKEGLSYFEGSAKNYQDVEAPFMHLAASFRTLCLEDGQSIYQIS